MKDIYMNEYDIKDMLKKWQGHRDKNCSVKFANSPDSPRSLLVAAIFATVLALETKYERGREQ